MPFKIGDRVITSSNLNLNPDYRAQKGVICDEAAYMAERPSAVPGALPGYSFVQFDTVICGFRCWILRDNNLSLDPPASAFKIGDRVVGGPKMPEDWAGKKGVVCDQSVWNAEWGPRMVAPIRGVLFINFDERIRGYRCWEVDPEGLVLDTPLQAKEIFQPQTKDYKRCWMCGGSNFEPFTDYSTMTIKKGHRLGCKSGICGSPIA